MTYCGQTILLSEVGRDVVRESMLYGRTNQMPKFEAIIVELHPFLDALHMLVKCGAPLFELNSEGKTAEQVARENGFVEAADFLKSEMEKRTLPE